MREILEQLAAQPGIRLAAFVMEDGVPVEVCAGPARASGPSGDATPDRSVEDSDALAALAAGWVLEVCDAVGPLSWDRMERMVLRGAHGTLVLRRAHTAWLVVLLVEGLRVEDVLLAMDGTAARLERLVRGQVGHMREPAAALPASAVEEDQDEATTSFSEEQELPKGR